MDSDLFLIYTTLPDYSTAHDVSDMLLKENLVACVNVFSGVTSMYLWDGNVNTNSECVVIMKTTESLCETVMQKIKDFHFYDVPAILAIPVQSCNPEFLAWVNEVTNSTE